MDLDFNQIGDQIKVYVDQARQAIEAFIEKAQAYFQSLTTYEIVAWVGEGVGLVLIILAFILW